MKRLLQVCFVAAMVFGLASCEKEGLKGSGSGASGNGGGGGNGASTTSLVGTSWQWYNGVVTFSSATNVTIATNQYGTYYGTYTYSNGSGVINVNIQGSPFTIPFTVNGSTMTAQNTPDGNITLTQVGGNNPNPNPNQSSSLNGTVWVGYKYYSSYTRTFTITFSTSSFNITSIDSDDGQSYFSDSGTYSYSGTTQSGNGTMNGNSDSYSFTISNGSMSVSGISGDPITFSRN